VFGEDFDPNSPPCIKVNFDPAPFGGEGINQVVKQQVGEMLVKDSLVPIGPKIELERFRFYDLLVGDITNEYLSEVRLTCFGTKTGEFIGPQFYYIRAFRISVGKGFEYSFWLSTSFSKLGQFFVFGIVF
jgi:hypothetical protein